MPAIRFRMKRGCGVHRMRRGGKMIDVHPGDVVTCQKADLGAAIDKFERLDPEPPPPEPKVGLTAVHRGHGKWDVVNEETKRIVNEKPLSKEEARELARTWKPEVLGDDERGTGPETEGARTDTDSEEK